MPLSADLTAAAAAATARHPLIAAAWVFGSVARGEAHRDSDLDVALLPTRPPTPAEAVALYEIAAALERYSPSGRVDLLLLGDQGPVLRHRVLRDGVLVRDADPELRLQFEFRTIAEYLDWLPTHEIAMRSTMAGLESRFRRGAA
jgi:uncharacterized protein